MRPTRNTRTGRSVAAAVAAGAALVGGAVAWDTVSAARQRRQLLARGTIRPLADRWVTVDGHRVYARYAASARPADPEHSPVVLVHGFGVSSSYWVPTAERLATGFAVYAPDLPGHGKSDAPAVQPDVPGLADVLVGWMDAVGLGRVSLVGNSMGCQIVVDAAVRYPDRVDRLVLIGPTVDPAARTYRQHVLRLVAGGLFERPSLIPLLAKDYGRMLPRLLPEARAMMSDRIEQKLPHVRQPVLLARGENDPVAPQRWAEEAARLAGGRPVAVVPGWGHAVHYSAASQLVAAILPFLRAPARTPAVNR